MPRKKKEELREETAARRFGGGSKHIAIALALLALAFFIALSIAGGAGIIGNAAASYLERVFGFSVYALVIMILLSALGLVRKEPSGMAKIAIGAILGYGGVVFLIEATTRTIVAGSFGNALYNGAVVLIGPILTILLGAFAAVASIALILNTRFAFVHTLLAKLAERRAAGADEEDANIPETTVDVSYPEELGEPEYAGANAESSETGLPDEHDDIPSLETHTVAPRAAALPYTPPPLMLLEKETGKPRPGDIKANANLIKRTLANFGINVEMDEVSVGPSITRYAMKPAEGVKLSRIVGLQDNLAMALAAHPLRIEAPIPGKSLVGIEIPNSTRSIVGLAQLLGTKEFQQSNKQLPFALGYNVSGTGVYADLAKAPHLLVAGATGSGKSVTIHCMIQSFLFRHGPGTLRLLMIDPKRVELTLYNHIPHLLAPVITDAKKTILALKWAAKEMERRYDILEDHAVRDIQSYHENILAGASKEDERDPLPYIVIVIDELADIMSMYPRELEAAVVRLAQKSRAVGIHLIISTQRPSTDVITGLIKANIPARIALQVPSQIDSRTIIDMPGAEKLLGAGDMLYMGGDMSKPVRIQSGFISEKEVKRIVATITKQNAALPDDISFAEASATDNIFASNALDIGESGGEDGLYEDARELVIEAGKASTSYLQRRLKIGYSRAARLLDMLEERGVVGPGEGSKPRDVFTSAADRQLSNEE